MAFLAAFLPGAHFSPVIGVWVDRFRKKVIIASVLIIIVAGGVLAIVA